MHVIKKASYIDNAITIKYNIENELLDHKKTYVTLPFDRIQQLGCWHSCHSCDA